MPPESPIATVARVIQLAVAPVFLLTALGTLLGVFSSRLGRVVDRARKLIERLPTAPPRLRAAIEAEIAVQLRRRKLVNTAIACATGAALAVCVLIASAFAGWMTGRDSSHVIAGLFIAAMIAFTGALLAFLSEVLLAVSAVRIEMDAATDADQEPAASALAASAAGTSAGAPTSASAPASRSSSSLP